MFLQSNYDVIRPFLFNMPNAPVNISISFETHFFLMIFIPKKRFASIFILFMVNSEQFIFQREQIMIDKASTLYSCGQINGDSNFSNSFRAKIIRICIKFQAIYHQSLSSNVINSITDHSGRWIFCSLWNLFDFRFRFFCWYVKHLIFLFIANCQLTIDTKEKYSWHK